MVLGSNIYLKKPKQNMHFLLEKERNYQIKENLLTS